MAMASTSQRDSKHWRSREGSVSAVQYTTRCVINCNFHSRTWATSRSRTLLDRCPRIAFGLIRPMARRWIGGVVTSRSVRPHSQKPSIAVLPFANMSGDSEQEYFSEGMTEDIITNLSRNHSFFVISCSTSFTYKGPSVDVKKVGRELGVRYLLEGSVRRAGNRVRVTAQLVEATTGTSFMGGSL